MAVRPRLLDWYLIKPWSCSSLLSCAGRMSHPVFRGAEAFEGSAGWSVEAGFVDRCGCRAVW